MPNTPFRQRLALQLLTRSNRLKTAGSQGFTLIELLVVVVILGVLGSVGYQQYLAQIGRANQNIALNTATASAKNCAALRLTGDQSAYNTADFLTAGNTVTGECTGTAEIPIVATIGTGNFQRRATATVTAENAVTPAVETAL